MILTSYAAFRHHFAEVARTTSVSLTYNALTPPTITRGAGSFVTDGLAAGQSVDVAGTVSNDGRYTVATVAALTLTLSASDTLTAEGPVTSSLTGAFYELDGAEQWPVSNVRANGFSGTWSLSPRPITVYPAQLTVNGLITDAAAGSSYTWYVRQRTDDSSLRYLNVLHADSTRTGTIALLITAKSNADLGVSSGIKLTTEQQIRMLKHVTVFCKRDSDGAIQLVDLLQLSHGLTE